MSTGSRSKDILSSDAPFDPYPTHRLKRVKEPTTRIADTIERIDQRDIAFARAARGDWGDRVREVFLGPNGGGMELNYPVCAAEYEMTLHVATVDDDAPAPVKAPIPDDPRVLTRHIKRLAYFLKADLVGISEIPSYAVYSHDMEGDPIEVPHKYAILMLIRKDSETTAASTGRDFISDSLSFSAYQRLALASQTMARYIRRLGYPAEAQHFSLYPKFYKILIPPLLLLAGLGEVGRSGIVINPYFGASYKVAAVLTDLPLVPDQPIDFGLQDFCEHCRICAEECPSKAISAGDKVVYNGYEVWKPDEERCARFFITNRRSGSACNMCVKVCPWTRPDSWNHNLVRWAAARSRLARRVAIWADSVRQDHRRAHEGDKWWFDLPPEGA